MVFAKVPLGEDAPADQYTIDHSGTLVLLDPQGRMAGVIQPPLQPRDIAEDLLTLTAHAQGTR
jgi:protein SCO1/2